jgi:hypothetical protein
VSAAENPPAFPEPYCVGPNDDLYPALPGMSLRDWFAGQALAGLCANESFLVEVGGIGDPDEIVAAASYEFADAMLAARAKGNGDG